MYEPSFTKADTCRHHNIKFQAEQRKLDRTNESDSVKDTAQSSAAAGSAHNTQAEEVEVEDTENLPRAAPADPLPNTPVFARWIDKSFYPGHFIKKVCQLHVHVHARCCNIALVRFYECFLQDESSGKFSISFEDGSKRQVRSDDVFACELLPVNQQVRALDEEKVYVGARVTRRWRRGDEWGYMVEFTVDHKTAR